MYNEKNYKDFVGRLHENYPTMFAGKYGGVEVGAGWWPIIETLCGQIQHYIDQMNSSHAKWPDSEHYYPVEQVVVAQIKEKFGGLRFYYDGGDRYVRGLVSMAEAWAARSCEECGAPGKQRPGGWVRTLCDFHVAEKEALEAEQARKDGLEL